MKNIKRLLKWILVFTVIVFTATLILLHFADLSVDEKDIRSTFAQVDISPIYKTLQYRDYTIHYTVAGDTTKPAILLIHGSPGSWDNFLDLMADSALASSFMMIAPDRPGYGRTVPDEPVRDLAIQADIIAGILRKEQTTAIVAGHSYGGSVAIQLAVDAPELVDALVLIAASVDPELEEMYWVQYVFDYRLFSWMLPGFLYASNEEILALEGELYELEGSWGRISVPVSIIQGGQDQLVPPANADYAIRKLENASVNALRPDSLDHFIPWTQPELIREELFRVSKLKPPEKQTEKTIN